jgi:hypothetical protein
MSENMSKWILLPVEFKGIWYNQAHGGLNIYLRDRFNPELAPDRLKIELRKYYPDLAEKLKEHEFANPKWMSKEEFEEQFGKVEAIVVNEEIWNSDRYVGYYNSLIFYTEHYIVFLKEYDGFESFSSIPRDWRKLISNEYEQK